MFISDLIVLWFGFLLLCCFGGCLLVGVFLVADWWLVLGLFDCLLFCGCGCLFTLCRLFPCGCGWY